MPFSRTVFRQAFTLIELLMVISIIAVLTSLALVVFRDAQETALHSRSSSLVIQIQAVLAAKLEEFETRQLPFKAGLIRNKVSGNPTNWAERQQIRQRVLLDWIRSEIPSEASHLTTPSPYPSTPFGLASYTWSEADYLDSYRLSSGARKVANELAGVTTGGDPQTLAAKCLYAMLQATWHNDSRASDICKPGEIVTDADGKKYIVDAFGDPLVLEVFIDWNGNGIFDRSIPDPPNPSPNSPVPEELDRNLIGFNNPYPLPNLNQIAVQVRYQRQNER